MVWPTHFIVLLLHFVHTCLQEIMIAMDLADKEDNPLLRSSLLEYVDGLLPSLNLSNSDLFKGSKHSGEWTFVFCNASYTPGHGCMNHWLPAVRPEDIGADMYHALTHSQDANAELLLLEREKEFGEAVMKEDFDEHYALGVSLQMAIDELKNWQALLKRCREAGYTPIEVPADGNCMLWSVKVHVEQDYQAEHVDPAAPQDLKVCEALRRQVWQCWKLGKDSHVLQKLHQFLFVEDPLVVDSGSEDNAEPKDCGPPVPKAEPKTPQRPRKRGSSSKEFMDLCTPPGADEKQPGPKRVRGCNRAPNWQKPSAASATFAIPGATKEPKKSKEAKPLEAPSIAKEPEAPAKKPKLLAKQPEANHAPPAEHEEPGEDEVPELQPEDQEMKGGKDDGQEGEPQKKKRRFRKRPPCWRSGMQTKMRKYLASIDIDYPEWQRAHWEFSGSAKAGGCPDGKFKDMKDKLIDAKESEITCEVCKKLLATGGYTFEDAEGYVDPEEGQHNLEQPGGQGGDDHAEPEQPEENILDELVLDAHAKKISEHYQAPCHSKPLHDTVSICIDSICIHYILYILIHSVKTHM